MDRIINVQEQTASHPEGIAVLRKVGEHEKVNIAPNGRKNMHAE